MLSPMPVGCQYLKQAQDRLPQPAPSPRSLDRQGFPYFLGIQTSIPLGLGLLGALSFVRFRTPVKDPAEIGFLLLLMAAAIGAATDNYLVTGVLFALVSGSLGVQWLSQNRFTLSGRAHLMISVDQASFPVLEAKVEIFVG